MKAGTACTAQSACDTINHMNNKNFPFNWANQTKLIPEHFNPPIWLYNTYHATVRDISFTYPKGWYEGINVWDHIDNQPVNYEFGYLGVNGWQTDLGSPIGLWFFVGAVPMPSVCNEAVKLVDIVSTTPVKLKGLAQIVYYCETIASPAYDQTKFIASGGLVSVHQAKPIGRFSVKDYLACHPITDNWFVYDPASPKKALLQFGCRSFGLVPSEAEQAYSTKGEALNFFKSSYYQQAKQIILSTTVG